MKGMSASVAAPDDELDEDFSAPVRTLSTADRCDACGAQAYVYVIFTAGGLLFCRHHFIMHEGKLREEAVRIVDETAFLALRP